jgi:hypothetical protein
MNLVLMLVGRVNGATGHELVVVEIAHLIYINCVGMFGSLQCIVRGDALTLTAVESIHTRT